jgi:hypothetical protein
MSAILSADDLNDFISPGVACIKPIETLPAKAEDSSVRHYHVAHPERILTIARIHTKSRPKTKPPQQNLRHPRRSP